MTEVILALGSNLGDRVANLQRAVELLGEEGIVATRASSVWETPPMPADQPAFHNAVIAAETALTPLDLLAAVKRVERALGRRPNRHWGPRPADIDILFYGEESITTPGLTIPHAAIRERAFVLVPLSEAVRGPLPVLGVFALGLLTAEDARGIVRTTAALGIG